MGGAKSAGTLNSKIWKTKNENRRFFAKQRRERADAALLRNGGRDCAAAADAAFVRKAAMLNRAGVPLKDLALMRDCLRDEPQDFCPELRGRLHAVREKLAAQIADLQQSERLLAELLSAGNGQ